MILWFFIHHLRFTWFYLFIFFFFSRYLFKNSNSFLAFSIIFFLSKIHVSLLKKEIISSNQHFWFGTNCFIHLGLFFSRHLMLTKLFHLFFSFRFKSCMLKSYFVKEKKERKEEMVLKGKLYSVYCPPFADYRE